MKKTINKYLNKLGYNITKFPLQEKYPLDFQVSDDLFFLGLFNTCKNYTMTGIERMFALYSSVKYLVNNNIEGDFVECGVWKGGSAMLIAGTLKELGVSNRKLYLYDTFEGMTEPMDIDQSVKGTSAKQMLDEQKKIGRSVWCYSPIEEVKENMAKTGYPEENITYVKGRVEDTIPDKAPGKISLLRLDTDWCESTRHEMENLYPLLSDKGVLIIDDYGHWQGSKRAVDEYFEKNKIHPLLNRIDYSGRLIIKN